MYWNMLGIHFVWLVMGLIETWDVLKFAVRFSAPLIPLRLIETWDVLKSSSWRT